MDHDLIHLERLRQRGLLRAIDMIKSEVRRFDRGHARAYEQDA